MNNAQALATVLGVLSGTTKGNPVRRAILQLLREKQMINYFVSNCTLNSFKFEPRHISAFSTVTVSCEVMHVAVDLITILTVIRIANETKMIKEFCTRVM